MNEISATPVTPYVSKPSAEGPTESPALSPVQSAMTPGLRASSSLILKTIFIRSEPISAILVKIPPAMRSAEGEADEAQTGQVGRDEEQDDQHHDQLDADQQHADADAGAQRDFVVR